MSLDFAFRCGGSRSPHVAPIASGRFAHLEMQDRQRMRSQRRVSAPRPKHASDAHRDPSPQLLGAWLPVEAELRKAIDEATFRIWLAPIHPHALIAGTWRLGCSESVLCWVRDRFGRVIQACAERPVEFVVCHSVNGEGE